MRRELDEGGKGLAIGTFALFSACQRLVCLSKLLGETQRVVIAQLLELMPQCLEARGNARLLSARGLQRLACLIERGSDASRLALDGRELLLGCSLIGELKALGHHVRVLLGNLDVLFCLLKGAHGGFFCRASLLGARLCGIEQALRFAQGLRIALTGLLGTYRLVQGMLGFREQGIDFAGIVAAGSERLQRTLPFCLLTSQLLLDAGQKRVGILTLLGTFGGFVVQGRLLTPGRVQLGVFFLKGLNRCSLCSKVCLELGDALG